MTVLIVDDDAISLQLLQCALESAGFDVLSATDGREALDLLRDGSIRMVIADWDMPGMSGPELCQTIRRDGYSGYIYFILLTSHDRPEYLVEGLAAGADDFISKPFHAPELILRLRVGQRVLSLETRDVVIFSLAKLAEFRHPETGRHLERVQAYSRILAEAMRNQPKYAPVIDAEFIRLIHQTSPLHDIGKVGIPDCVLMKPGSLNSDEFELMKTHSTIGARTLDEAAKGHPGARFLEMARDIAAAHHERYDGSGYPAGLKGDAIPLAGRIVALADVYDALTSKRCYKQAFAHTVARSMILEQSGKQFDPDVIDAFLEAEAHFLAIQAEFSDEAALAV